MKLSNLEKVELISSGSSRSKLQPNPPQKLILIPSRIATLTSNLIQTKIKILNKRSRKFADEFIPTNNQLVTFLFERGRSFGRSRPRFLLLWLFTFLQFVLCLFSLTLAVSQLLIFWFVELLKEN